MHYDPETRHLTLTGTGGRQQAEARKAIPAVLALLGEHPDGLSGRKVEAQLIESGEKRDAVREALTMLRADKRVITKKGPRRAESTSSVQCAECAETLRADHPQRMITERERIRALKTHNDLREWPATTPVRGVRG